MFVTVGHLIDKREQPLVVTLTRTSRMTSSTLTSVSYLTTHHARSRCDSGISAWRGWPGRHLRYGSDVTVQLSCSNLSTTEVAQASNCSLAAVALPSRCTRPGFATCSQSNSINEHVKPSVRAELCCTTLKHHGLRSSATPGP